MVRSLVRCLMRFRFDKGTPIYPFEKLKLETTKETFVDSLDRLGCPMGEDNEA